MTRTPRLERLEIERIPVEIFRPARKGVHPAFLFVNGAHPLRRNEPVVQRLSNGLARAGFIAVVPDLPGLGEGEITTKLPDALAAVVHHASGLPDVRGGRVALVGASTGASLALIAAAQPELAERISLVAAVAPYDTSGFRSPDWTGFQWDSADTEARAYPGLPGRWAGIPYDFVRGGAGLDIPGLPDEVRGCLGGT